MLVTSILKTMEPQTEENAPEQTQTPQEVSTEAIPKETSPEQSSPQEQPVNSEDATPSEPYTREEAEKFEKVQEDQNKPDEAKDDGPNKEETANKLIPTVGRVINYRTIEQSQINPEQPNVIFPAIITRIHGISCVNLTVFLDDRTLYLKSIIQGSEVNTWDWTDFQKGIKK